MSILNWKKPLLFFILISMFVITGCFNRTTTTDEMYTVLENVVDLEQDFEKQQQPLVELEKEEKEIYSEIIGLGMKEFEQIVSLSEKALTIVDKRQEHMQKEEESIQASKQEFEKFAPLIEKLDEGELKTKANELYDTMQKRFATHDTLFDNYMKGIEHDKELYQMFQKEGLSIDELEEQITKINDTYKLVLDSNEEFNEYTKQYNEIKLGFYKAAGIEISEEQER
ncbi:YkyA family protein [Robertmurraya sp. DFI.2.37]|uniref:YkyA family protein n=1 Tax=Robertmurraya sp. DFI.2.37 TaxID=3031819 RepID=UPI001246C99C|nr:YkyA family protein [Robertmurraya sp. DFI.2.37]MDF1506754.1 YkyA family protein [Robertmurraya sp. DFI.2.37]